MSFKNMMSWSALRLFWRCLGWPLLWPVVDLATCLATPPAVIDLLAALPSCRWTDLQFL